jgi:hypothetical protein
MWTIFPSRSPAGPPKQQRRRRTGRSVQFNIKATPEAIERFIAISVSPPLSVGRKNSGTANGEEALAVRSCGPARTAC